MPPACPACRAPETRTLSAFTSDTFGAPREFAYRECPACSMVFVDPSPSQADLDALYASPRYYAMTETETLGADGLRDRPAWKVAEYAHILKGLVRRAPRSSRVLDVGCGWGLFMEQAKAAGYDPEGIDPSPGVVEYVSGRLGLPARQAGLAEAEPNRYGVVAMLDVIEHVPDPVGFAQLARRVLIPGGWLVVRVPNYDGFTNYVVPGWLKRLRRENPPVFLQHLSEFRARSLRALLTTSGFGEIEVVGLENFQRYYMKSPVKRAAWQALSAAGVLFRRECSLIGYARSA
jgi:2-polyprenyl-3-methyl-5-hydroxy-6-metoxy-1,4-benzoquinol methylase